MVVTRNMNSKCGTGESSGPSAGVEKRAETFFIPVMGRKGNHSGVIAGSLIQFLKLNHPFSFYLQRGAGLV